MLFSGWGAYERVVLLVIHSAMVNESICVQGISEHLLVEECMGVAAWGVPHTTSDKSKTHQEQAYLREIDAQFQTTVIKRAPQ